MAPGVQRWVEVTPLRGDDLAWLRDGHRAGDSPLKLARRKAQRLASKLRDELTRFGQETGYRVPDPREVVPFADDQRRQQPSRGLIASVHVSAGAQAVHSSYGRP